MTKNFAAPWFIRRVIYAVASLALVVAAGFGVISEAQVDSISAQIATIAAPLIGLVTSLLALGNTHAGSDSTVTVTDVHNAQLDPDAIAASVVEHINTYGKHADTLTPDERYIQHIRG